MTSRVTPAALPSEVSRHTAIATSSGVLGLACIGMFFYGLGNILAGPNASTYPHRLSWILQCVGPLLVAIAVTLHIDHLSYRIGRSAVVLIIGGAFLQGGGCRSVCVRPDCVPSSGMVQLVLRRVWIQHGRVGPRVGIGGSP